MWWLCIVLCILLFCVEKEIVGNLPLFRLVSRQTIPLVKKVSLCFPVC
jgi:hypothetical protein